VLRTAVAGTPLNKNSVISIRNQEVKSQKALNLLLKNLPDLTDAYLKDADLSNADLQGVNLSDADLQGANLSDADIQGANLSDTNLLSANLLAADLEGADLSNAGLLDANLSSANLEEADLSGAKLRRANLTDANVLKLTPDGTKLRDANLTGADLQDADLTGANLRNASLKGTKLKHANLTSANLRKADLTDVNLSGANLTNADFRADNIHNLTVNRKTKFGSDLREQISNMTTHARAYHDFRIELSNKGYDKMARDLYVLEQKARTRAAFPRNLITFFGGLLSGLLTGYGVRPRQVFLSSIFLIAVTTLWFNQTGVVYDEWNSTHELLAYQFRTGSLHYSVVTFVTSPPHPPQNTRLVTNLLVTLETYLGTVFTLLLGYTLSNRSRV
jgi:uncharacterized protein YjbI with pentapeptide repeats